LSRTAIVTGAAGGIGQATCARLRADGWSVIGLDRVEVVGVDSSRVVDVADPSALVAALEDVADVGALVSNAAMMEASPIGGAGPAVWQRTIDTNLSATFHLLDCLADRLAASGGAVVAVSSVHAVATTAGATAYAASKAGLLGLVRGAALELAERGIRVNAVLPGATDTPMLGRGPGFDELVSRTPLGRIARPEEIAEAIAFLLDPARAGFITGQTLVVDGGVLSRLATE
jgi:NAD(P)-dependent dehydrogenase (short-subunit alcohol dehydrogenase family)